MSVSLLDVNVLVALAWPVHVHHRVVKSWMEANRAAGWAMCPFTEAGFIRISSNPRLFPEPVVPRAATLMLDTLTRYEGYEFWADDLSVLAALQVTPQLSGHKQVTDAYLLALAKARSGTLVTLDKGIAAYVASDPDLVPHLKYLSTASD